MTRQINTDGTDKLFSYEGCGCAGGQVTTIQSELVPRDDIPTQNARRTSKVYEDILGRTYKSETLNWNGSVYSTNKSFFNGRDQVTLSRQYAGADGSSTFQDTTMTYDGYGRLKTQHRPEQNAGTATVYNYFNDDRIQQVVDARGATINYQYNSLGLVTQVSTTSPDTTNIPITPTVTFSYDNLGNRISMTDGTGSTTYAYDQMSRIISETKQFNELAQALTLQYEYSFSGQLNKINILPNSTSVSYSFDKVNRVAAISGQGFSDTNGNATITNIVSNISYRAWNSLKSISNGNNVTTSFNYDDNLKISSFQVPDLVNLNYQYNADGKVKFVDDLRNPKFDRAYAFDHKGRLKTSTTAENANGSQSSDPVPYSHFIGYDAFDNVTQRSNDHWTANYSSSQTFVNHRRNGWTYNADGDAVNFDGNLSTYNASGQEVKLQNKVESSCRDATMINCSQYKVETTMSYDGDGQEVVKQKIRTEDYFFNWNMSRKENERVSKEFELKSTVLGGSVVYSVIQRSNFRYPSISNSHTDTETRVFNEGRLIAKMETLNFTGSPIYQFTWRHVDPTSIVVAESNAGAKWTKEMLDPNGSPVGFENPYPPQPEPQTLPRIWDESGNGEMGDMVEVDGILMNRGQAERLSAADVISQCPRQGCGPQLTERGWAYWTAFADGYEGYMPEHGRYWGNGFFSFADSLDFGRFNRSPIRINFGVQRQDNKQLQAAVNECAEDMFGVSVKGNIDWSRAGHSGKIDFKINRGDYRDYTVNPFTRFTYPRMSTVTVHNDVNSFSGAQLSGGVANPNGNILGLYRAHGKGTGFHRFYDSHLQVTRYSNVTYTANDLGNQRGATRNGVTAYWSNFQGIQIHEAGNFLAELTGLTQFANSRYSAWINPDTGLLYNFSPAAQTANAGLAIPQDNGNLDTDSGQAFELCVMIRYRINTGYKP